ncbi:FlgD immunoglobulin-like domain containing protein, partial [Candidatus Eisenbacteria bacterium]
ESAHLFEVTESGTTVWDYYEPGGARIARAPRYGGLANVQESDDVAFSHRVRFLPTRGNLCGHAAAFRFLASEDGEAELAVFNTIGQRIRVLMQEPVRAGQNGVVWNGRDADGRLVPSGVYLARVNLAGTSASCRVLVLK